ncbi:YbaK/EbsC family protein [Patescibacteria group bacterium]|nr:YbaK/EbsC family protein [Patescibacteria group bacterium]
MKNAYEKICKLFDNNNLSYEILIHDKGASDNQLLNKFQLRLHQGVKSMVLKIGDHFSLIVLAGDCRLDMKKVKKYFNENHIRLATNEEITPLMGCGIGSCYPIGNIIDMQTYTDNSLSNNKTIFFNPGVPDKWIKMAWEDYIKITRPQMIAVSE